MMTNRTAAGERQNPQSEGRIIARFADWGQSAEFIRASGLTNVARQQAEHMTACVPGQSRSKMSLLPRGRPHMRSR